MRVKRFCEVFTAYMRETLLGSPLGSFREPPNVFHDPAVITALGRTSRVQNQPSRYTENKVLFSVPCVYVRKPFFLGFLSVPGHSHSSTGAAEQDARLSPYGSRGVNIMTGSPRIEFRAPLQGTLKTRYFSVYLVYVRVKRGFCRSDVSPHGSSPRRHHDIPSDARGFSGGLRPGDVFSPAFLLKRRHFSLKKWKRMAYYFNLVF